MPGELNQEQIEFLLKTQVIGRIGCFADNKIYVVPVTYAYDGNYIYAHSNDGMKMKMMRKNPNVCFETDLIQNMANWQSVIAWGKFEELKDLTSKKSGMKILLERLTPIMTGETAEIAHSTGNFHQSDVKEFEASVFRIKLSEKTGRFEKTVTT